MSRIHYRLNCDDYVAHDGDRPVGGLTPEVAVAFAFDLPDRIWIVFKHGPRSAVEHWVSKQRAATGGKPHLADEIHVLSGKLPLWQLNQCIQQTERLPELLAACTDVVDGAQQGLLNILLDGKPITPALLTRLGSPSPVPSPHAVRLYETDDVSDAFEKCTDRGDSTPPSPNFDFSARTPNN